MLTITAPIKTTLNPDLCETNESFAKRIQANYDQMSEFITREDLFHLVTQPPEIFMMGDGGSSFFSETEIHNTQLKKVEIVNNLMNRILVSADGNLTYQDEVYITNVLHKLGIRDERTFMKKVYELTEETRENNRLIETYWQNRQELSQMIAYYRMQKKEGDRTEITEASDQILHLHEDVYKRWMTAAIYRMQNNFRNTSDSNTYVTNESYRMTEEQRLSQQLLLQRLRESVRGESVPLVYRHDNYYEQPGDNIEDLSQEAVAQQIASAVLLSMVDNLYENITSRTETIGDRFYRTENAFYGAADHVFERMEGNTAYIISEHRGGDITSEITDNIKNEYSAVNEILQHYYAEGDTLTENLFEADVMDATPMEHVTQPAPTEEAGSTEIHVDERNDIEQRLYQMNFQNEIRRQEYIDNLERLSRSNASAAQLPVDEQERRAQMQLAFEHPEEFKRLAKEQEEIAAEVTDEAAREFINSLPARSRDVFNIIESYMENPEKFLGTKLITVNAETSLVREKIEAELAEKRTETEKRLTETIDTVTEHETAVTERQNLYEQTVEQMVLENTRLIDQAGDVKLVDEAGADLVYEIDRIKNETTNTNTVETAIQNERRITDRITGVENVVGRESLERINLVHKVNDLGITDETIDNIRREINQIRNDTSRMETKIENNENVVQREVNNVNTTVINEQNVDQITRMIQDNINQQIGNITSKVYSRLERQLMSERRRRGM